jgi:hypothetical protein
MSKKKLKIIYITENEKLSYFKQNQNNYDTIRLYDFLNKNFDFYIINISNIIKKDSAEMIKIERFNCFTPMDMGDFAEFIRNHNILAFTDLAMNTKFYKIFRFIKINNIKLLSYSNLVFSYKTKEFSIWIKKFFYFPRLVKELNYILYRFFVVLEIYPRISFHFECDIRRIKNIQNSFISTLQKKIPKLKLSYYDKIVRINTQYYSDSLSNSLDLTEKYIVVCDSPLVHPAITQFEGKVSREDGEKYYKDLFNFLKMFENIFKVEIMFCAHPKGEYKDFKNFNLIEENFKVTFHKTNYYISKAKFVLFQASSAIHDAIIFEKPIIQYNSKLISKLTQNKIKDFNSKFNCTIVNIENIQKINSSIYEKIKSERKNYTNYKESLIGFEKGKKDLNQIGDYIKETINF